MGCRPTKRVRTFARKLQRVRTFGHMLVKTLKGFPLLAKTRKGFALLNTRSPKSRKGSHFGRGFAKGSHFWRRCTKGSHFWARPYQILERVRTLYICLKGFAFFGIFRFGREGFGVFEHRWHQAKIAKIGRSFLLHFAFMGLL